ncbi:MAG: ion transporter [Pseudomonadota bacterium]
MSAIKERKGLNRGLFWLYEGHGTAPYWFRVGLLIFDLATIAYFLWAPFQDRGPALGLVHPTLDYVIGAILALDLAARFYIARPTGRFFQRVYNWADLVVVVTLFAPLFTQNFAFLRLIRAVRIVRAFTLLRRAKGVSAYLKEHERVFDRVTNLVVFVFLMAALVYVAQEGTNAGINNYVDALYFTVTSLTTTGYGDILMEGVWGRMLAIVIMVLGLTLFLRLLRAITAGGSEKVDVACDVCGLSRHDRDAVHCKHCGAVMKIETGGVG